MARIESPLLFKVPHRDFEQSLDWDWLSGMPEALGLNPSTRENERDGQKGRKGVGEELGWAKLLEAPAQGLGFIPGMEEEKVSFFLFVHNG